MPSTIGCRVGDAMMSGVDLDVVATREPGEE